MLPPTPVPRPPPLQHAHTAPAGPSDLARARWRNVRYGEGDHNTGLPTYAERDSASLASSDALPFGECFVASEIVEEGHDTWLKLETGKWVLAREKDRVNCVDMTRWEDHQGRIPKSATRGQDYPVGMFTEGFSGESNISLVSASGDAFWREVNIEMLCRGIATATLFEKGWEGDDVFQDWVAFYAMNISRYSAGKRFVVIVKPTSMWRRYAGEGCCGVPLGEVRDAVGRAQWKEVSWIHKVQSRINCRWGEVEFITALSFLQKYCHWSHDDCMTAANEKLMHFCGETFHTAEPQRCVAELGCMFWAWIEAFGQEKPDVEEDAIACHSLLQRLAMQTQRPRLELRLQASESNAPDAWTKLLAVAKAAAPEAYAAVLREPALDCLREQRQRIEGLQARVAGMHRGRPPEVVDLEVKLEQSEKQVKRQADRISELEALQERLNEGQKAEQRKDAKIQELEAQVKLLQLDGGLKKQPVPEQSRPRFVITSGNDCDVRMWSFETGMTEREFHGHDSIVWSACLSADERYLFTTSDDCTARMWSVGSGECKRIFRHGKGAAPNWACVTPDLEYLCTAVNDCTAKIWQVESSKLLSVCGHRGCVNSVCISPDGGSLFTASDDNQGRMWQVPSGTLHRTFDGQNGFADVDGSQRGLYSCFLAGNGRLFFTAAFDGQTTMFDVHSGDILQRFRSMGSAKNVCASPSGDRVFIGKGSDGGSIIEMRCTKSGGLLRKFVGHGKDVTAQWVSPDGLWLCSSSLDKTAKVWNTSTGEVVLTYNGHKSFVQGIVAA